MKNLKEDCKVIARIVLIMFWSVGVFLTLITAQKEPKILAVTGIGVGMAMLATKESKRFWAIIEWLSFIIYLIILSCIVATNSYNVPILIGATIIVMIVITKRIKNFSDEEMD